MKLWQNNLIEIIEIAETTDTKVDANSNTTIDICRGEHIYRKIIYAEMVSTIDAEIKIYANTNENIYAEIKICTDTDAGAYIYD